MTRLDPEDFRAAGWEVKKTSKDGRSLRHGGGVPLSMLYAPGRDTLLSVDLPGALRSFSFPDDEHGGEVTRVLLDWAPRLTKRNWREMVRDLALAGVPVEFVHEGQSIPVTADPGDANRRTPWWRRLLG